MPTASHSVAIAVPTLAIAAATLGLLALLGPDWTRFAPATCLGTHCFCELPRAALLRQHANTLSSLGFVAVGGWVLLDAPQATALRQAAARWFGITAIVIGVGSAALHATLTLWGQFADVVGMYLFGSLILTLALQRWLGWADARAVAVCAGLSVVLIALLTVAPETRRWLFAVILIVNNAVEWFAARPRRPGVAARWFVYGFLANALAFVILILDQRLTLCAPTSLLQGHAAWHLLGAAALACNYLYYRSERRA